MPTRKVSLADLAVHFDKAIVDVAGAPSPASHMRSGAPQI
jgi:hypothetical protein